MESPENSWNAGALDGSSRHCCQGSTVSPYANGKQTQGSRVLLANAWHHRSDAISSVAALVGIAGAQWGIPMMDPIAGVWWQALL
ncbi:MAG: hypothetical protein CM1200mP30_33940 [Pseudomonadota bacterium]|nr:MAG: hypothetical protein CM1200mP30_33940 [Pseudomonadota bacterium]